MKPLARHVDLVATEIGKELLLDDTRRQESHRLNALVAFIYRHADGHTSVAELTALARERLRRAVSKEMIISALDQLSEANLLASASPPVSQRPPVLAEAAAG